MFLKPIAERSGAVGLTPPLRTRGEPRSRDASKPALAKLRELTRTYRVDMLFFRNLFSIIFVYLNKDCYLCSRFIKYFIAFTAF